MRHDVEVAARIEDFDDLAHQLPDVTAEDRGHYRRLQVSGRTFGYLWPATRTVGLRQTIADQLGLVAERPEVFEVQYTSGGFGWVVVRLEGVERDELAELVFEAWWLTAPTASRRCPGRPAAGVGTAAPVVVHRLVRRGGLGAWTTPASDPPA